MMFKTTLLTVSMFFSLSGIYAQWASYTDMIRRENRATTEYINRMNAYYNKPSGSTSVLYDYKVQQQAKRDEEKAKRQAEYKKLQRFIDSMELADRKKSDERGKKMLEEHQNFLAIARPALHYLNDKYNVTTEEAQNFAREELMINGQLIPNYMDRIKILDNLTILETKLASLSQEEALTKLEKVSALKGIYKIRYMKIGFKLEERAPNDSIANDNMFFNLFRMYYSDQYEYNYSGTLEEQIATLARFELLMEKYPVLGMDFIKTQLKGNPYKHKVSLIFAKKMSKSKENAAKEKAFAQQKDVEMGMFGYSEALKSAKTILALALKMDVSPAYILLEGKLSNLNNGMGNSLVLYTKYYPQFRFWEDMAKTGDSLSIVGYILHTYSSKDGTKGAKEILDLAYEEGLNGNLLFFQMALELLPQGSSGRAVIREKGPKLLASFLQAVDEKYSKNEAAEIRIRLKATIDKPITDVYGSKISLKTLLNSML